MGQPPGSDEVQTPARVALSALDRLCALTDNFDRIHADRAIVSRFLYDVEGEMEGIRQASEYRESQVKVEARRVLEFDKQLTALREAMHASTLELTMRVSSASALCDCLDALDAGDLCRELHSVRVALSGQCVTSMATFLDACVCEDEVRKVLRQALMQLEVKPETASSTEKWAFEQLRRKARPRGQASSERAVRPPWRTRRICLFPSRPPPLTWLHVRQVTKLVRSALGA